MIPFDPDRKLDLRLELEFENINQALWEVGEVEAIMGKEKNIKN